jgi:hypothetical protein
LEYHLAEARKRVDEIKKSTSWQLTKPLRKIGEIAPFLRRKSAE